MTADLADWTLLVKSSTTWTFSCFGSRFLSSVKKITTSRVNFQTGDKGILRPVRFTGPTAAKRKTPHPKRPDEGYGYTLDLPIRLGGPALSPSRNARCL